MAERTELWTFRVIIFASGGTVVLLEAQALGYTFPLVEIPKFTRYAQEIYNDSSRPPADTVCPFVHWSMEQNPAPVDFAVLEDAEPDIDTAQRDGLVICTTCNRASS